MAEYAGLAGPSTPSAGTLRGCPCRQRGTETCDGSLHQHQCTQPVEQLRGSVCIRVYTDCLGGHEKEESGAWTTVREKQQEVPRSKSVNDSGGGHKELRMAEWHKKGRVCRKKSVLTEQYLYTYSQERPLLR